MNFFNAPASLGSQVASTIASGADNRSAAGVPRLHPGAVTSSAQIRKLLEVLKESAQPLTRGLNRRIELEAAVIEHVGDNSLMLNARSFEPDARDIVFLNFSVGSQSYFFQARVLARGADAKLELEIPDILYERERRSSQRISLDTPRPVSITYGGGGSATDLIVADLSSEGIAIDVPDEVASRLDYSGEVTVSNIDASALYGVVRNKRPAPKSGWTRIGLEIDATRATQLEWTVIRDLSPPSGREKFAQTVRIAARGAQLAFERAIRRFGAESKLREPSVVDIYDSANHRIRALVNAWGPLSDATAVVIPPAWGRTKETLMPLALTMVECFRRSGRPIR